MLRLITGNIDTTGRRVENAPYFTALGTYTQLPKNIPTSLGIFGVWSSRVSKTGAPYDIVYPVRLLTGIEHPKCEALLKLLRLLMGVQVKGTKGMPDDFMSSLTIEELYTLINEALHNTTSWTTELPDEFLSELARVSSGTIGQQSEWNDDRFASFGLYTGWVIKDWLVAIFDSIYREDAKAFEDLLELIKPQTKKTPGPRYKFEIIAQLPANFKCNPINAPVVQARFEDGFVYSIPLVMALGKRKDDCANMKGSMELAGSEYSLSVVTKYMPNLDFFNKKLYRAVWGQLVKIDWQEIVAGILGNTSLILNNPYVAQQMSKPSPTPTRVSKPKRVAPSVPATLTFDRAFESFKERMEAALPGFQEACKLSADAFIEIAEKLHQRACNERTAISEVIEKLKEDINTGNLLDTAGDGDALYKVMHHAYRPVINRIRNSRKPMKRKAAKEQELAKEQESTKEQEVGEEQKVAAKQEVSQEQEPADAAESTEVESTSAEVNADPVEASTEDDTSSSTEESI